VRVVSLHADVLLATSAIWQTNCVIVRGRVLPEPESPVRADPAHLAGTDPDPENPVRVRIAGEPDLGAETFVIDSPVLPEELDALPALLHQAGFPAPSGLLATHADWDHLLGRLAFPHATLGCAETTVERMRAHPGAAQRELRAFDEEHYVSRAKPLALGSIQALDVPGGCEIGSHELALWSSKGHTSEGMAILIGWVGVLVVGDYLSSIELPVLGEGSAVDAYLQTLERLRPLVAQVEHVVPGHGPVLDSERAATVLEEDVAYLTALDQLGDAAPLPAGRRTGAQRAIHRSNVERVRAA
jgi:glyoxylase-like metal-dependent hydrolase (beta-lactamase superfamily II)